MKRPRLPFLNVAAGWIGAGGLTRRPDIAMLLFAIVWTVIGIDTLLTWRHHGGAWHLAIGLAYVLGVPVWLVRAFRDRTA